MRNRDGTLTDEAVALINASAGVEPVKMYPLSQLAADLGRAGLVSVAAASQPQQPATGLASRKPAQQPWLVSVTEEGWECVTDPVALDHRRRELALRRLRNPPPDDGWPSFVSAEPACHLCGGSGVDIMADGSARSCPCGR